MLLRNNGNGTFTDVAGRSAASRHRAHRRGSSQRPQQRPRDRLVVTGGDSHRSCSTRARARSSALDCAQPAAPAHTRRRRVSTSTRTAGWTWPSRQPARRALTLWHNVNGTSFERSICRSPSPTATASPPSTTTTTAGSIWPPSEHRRQRRRAAGAAQRAGPLRGCVRERRRDGVALKNPRALLAGDLDQDNDTDLIVTQARGRRPSSCATTAATRTTPSVSR